MGLYGSPQIGYHASGQPPKRRRRIPLWLWLPCAVIGGLILLFFLVVLIIAIVQVASGKVSLTPSPSVPAIPTATLSTAGPGNLLEASGTGPKITGRFTAKSGWDMSWSYNCGQNVGGFSAQVYDASNQPTLLGVSDVGTSASGVKRYSTPGTYYLQISSGCSWSIAVRAASP